MGKSRGTLLFAAWMKERKDRTQKGVADELGTVQGNVSGWILGRQPSIQNAMRLRKLTGIPVEAWAEPIEEAESSPRAVDGTAADEPASGTHGSR